MVPVVDALGTAGFRIIAAVPVPLELVVEVVAFLIPAAAPRVLLAFSTIVDNKLDEDFVLKPLAGEAGRAIMDLAGEEAGRSGIFLVGEAGRSKVLGRTRAFVVVGDKTCPCRNLDVSEAARGPRGFFLGLPVGSTEFSLSSIAPIDSLYYS